jgi:hypothetical protein
MGDVLKVVFVVLAVWLFLGMLVGTLYSSWMLRDSASRPSGDSRG